MKKLILSFVALLSMTVAMAQDNAQQDNKRGNRPDPKEMIQKRTQEMTEKYSLTAEQAEKVKALNEKYMGKMGGPRGGKPGDMKEGGSQKEMKDGERPEPPKDMKQGGDQKGPRGPRPDMTEYNNELKAILTADQYKAYEADQQKRMEEMKSRHQKKQ